MEKENPKEVVKKTPKKYNYTKKTGRPTKYNKERIQQVSDYQKMSLEISELPTIEGLAGYLNITTDTIWRWTKSHKKFSDAIKVLKEKQAHLMQSKAISGEYNATMSIFLLKNNHGFKDRQDLDVTSNDEPITGIVYTPPANGRNTPETDN